MATMTTEQAILGLWIICDEEWTFDAASDQWWLVRARCPHGEWKAASNGALDLETAFERVYDKVAEAHR